MGDTAIMAGASQKQLRHWEARGCITQPMRIVCDQRAYRHFNMKQVEQIQGMKRLIGEGYAYSHFQFPGCSPMKIARQV